MPDQAAPFKAAPNSPKFSDLEEQILQFWQQNSIYQQSLERRQNAPSFVFYEGPPTANGMPHPGHCLTRTIKDVFPRYKTMRGFRCERKAGWDTHGLPVEVEVGKELGIHSKEEIEAYGIEPFIQKCQQSVWRYMQQWQRLTERLGFWVDLDEAYVTYHQSYVESVWWSLKNLFDRGLLYQGHKIVWWWAQGGTALSAGEVGQGYREVADPSVYVRFPLLDHPNCSLLVWTTTPWTLPSNMYAAVHPELEYSLVKQADSEQLLYIASSLVETIAAKSKTELETVETCKGSDLLGLRYTPPFDGYYRTLGDAKGQLIEPVGDRTDEYFYWRVVEADFVTTDSGTGIVHQAAAFGEVDYEVYDREQRRFVEGERPELLCAIGADGKFVEAVSEDLIGTWVKDADKPLSRELKERDLMFLQEQYLHDYPFCWRAEQDPLIQYPRRSWFIRTTRFRDLMLKNNSQIGWQPEHIRDGRFGNFLESNVDWALSRERFWGTPLPIWVCEETGRMEAIGSYEELLAKPGVQGTEVWQAAKAANPELVDDLRVHKPYIDAITYDSPFADGKRMQRVSEVIDCWYDSGAMPFAQWGYPHQGKAEFEDQFPADFISEAIDQTRGWFYSQLAIATMLFGEGAAISEAGCEESAADSTDYPIPFRNCIVLGLMLSQWWERTESDQKKTIVLDETEAKEAAKSGGKFSKQVGKMSKSLRNYRSPEEIFQRYGADALRWYLLANQAPWNSIIYAEQTIKDSIPEFLLRLWNTFSFFTIYAEIDGFDPRSAGDADEQLSPGSLASSSSYRPAEQRSEIDRWILSELNRTIATVTERMDALDNYNACQAITSLLDGLSNWFVRRSRDRFWANDKQSQDKLDAYWTLYETLLELTKLAAPFTPFLADTIWQGLTEPFEQKTLSSVHLCDFPKSDPRRIDNGLSDSMRLLREIASLGRAARAAEKLKVRLPLSEVTVILTDDEHLAWLQSHDALIREELNVKAVHYTTDGDQYVQYTVVPNFKRLGPKVGKQVPQVKKALAGADGNELLNQLQDQGHVVLELGEGSVPLDGDDIEVRLKAKDGWAAAQGQGCVVVLNTEVTDELQREGISKDIIRIVQNQRKAIDCGYTDRIAIFVEPAGDEVKQAIEEHRGTICEETLAESLELSAGDDSGTKSEHGTVWVSKVSS